MQTPRRYTRKNHPLLPGLSTEDEGEEPSKIIEAVPETATNPEPQSKVATEIKPLSDFVL